MNKLKQKGFFAVLTLSLFLAAAAGFWLWHRSHQPVWHVALFQGAKETNLTTRALTVAGAIQDEGIELKPEDVVVPPLNASVTEGMEIDLGIVQRRDKEFKKTVVHPIHVDYTDNLNVGEIIDIQQGKDGQEDLTTESFFLNGEV